MLPLLLECQGAAGLLGLLAFLPSFWAMPSAFLCDSAAALATKVSATREELPTLPARLSAQQWALHRDSEHRVLASQWFEPSLPG